MKGLSDFSCTYQMGVKQKISEMYTNKKFQKCTYQ